jgi:hypothetical protein
LTVPPFYFMPTRYKDHAGFFLIDERVSIAEWTKDVGGKFASLLELEIRESPTDDEPWALTLWAKVRSGTDWDPKWCLVPPEVTFTLADLRDYQHREDKAVRLMGAEVKRGRAKTTKSKFKIDRREYI